MKKIVIAVLIVVLLALLGFKGRQQARIQAQLDDIASIRDLLQQSLDSEQADDKAMDAAFTLGLAASPAYPKNDLINTLKLLLDQFTSQHSQKHLLGAQRFDLRLAKATLELAERRFDGALGETTEEDQPFRQSGPSLRRLQIRGDAFYGLHQCQAALECYRQILNRQPKRTIILVRSAACSDALGRRAEAVTYWQQLARIHAAQGAELLVQKHADASVSQYQAAISIQARLVENEGQKQLAVELAMNQNDLGNALLVLDKPDEAAELYRKAIELETRNTDEPAQSNTRIEAATSRTGEGNAFFLLGKPDLALQSYSEAAQELKHLLEQGSRKEIAGELPLSLIHRAHALLAQQKIAAAIKEYDQAIEILASLVEQEGQGQLGIELATCYNNRGAVRRAAGQLQSGCEDFESSVKILKSLAAQPGRGSPEPPLFTKSVEFPGRAHLNLDVIIGYADKAVDFLTRVRVIEQGELQARAVHLAMSLKNRGYAYLDLGRPADAAGDFKKSVEIYSSLVENQAQKDLTTQFAKSLVALAWIYAASPESALRNGTQAEQLARKACQISEWKHFLPVDALAAAFAEMGNFPAAIQWQEKAIDLAPARQKALLHARLELYQAGHAYRSTPAAK